MILDNLIVYGPACLFAVAFIVTLCYFIKMRRTVRREIEKSIKNEELERAYLSHITSALRLPLSTINKMCNELEGPQKSTMTDEERDKIISIISLNNHEMFTYLNELLEITNFDGAVPAFSTIEVNIIELIMSYRREIMHETKSGVLVCVKTDMSPHCKATLNTTLFRQIMMHLLRIAARRTTEGVITIKYGWEREGLHFWLKDTGAPIPENVRQSLFADNVSEEDIQKLENKSTFISLMICKTLVSHMGGTIAATSSEGEEAGTTIDFWIPCYVRFA